MTRVRAKCPGGELSDPFPDVVRIEPSGICNFHCRHCPVGREGGRRGMLSFDYFKAYLDALPLTPRVLVLYHGGEPLINPDLFEMIEYAKGVGVCHVVLNTNASKITDKMDFSLVDDMRVSFDGTSPEENDRIRKGGEFKWNARRVRALAKSEHAPRQLTIYNINTIGRPANYLLDFFKGYPVVFRSDQLKVWPRTGAPVKSPSVSPVRCPSLWETFNILASGEVVMCCEDLLGEDVQGNLNDDWSLDIWARMQTVRNSFARMEYPELCQSCWRLVE